MDKIRAINCGKLRQKSTRG